MTYKCPICDQKTVTEHLVDLADIVDTDSPRLIILPISINDGDIERIKLALRVRGMGSAFIFRAIVEGWSQDRIVREVH